MADTTRMIKQKEFPFRPLMLLEQACFINVYLDEEGETHYSSEEFSKDQSGIFDYEDALEEAFQRTIVGTIVDVPGYPIKRRMRYSYVATLSNTLINYTAQIEMALEELENAAELLRGMHKPIEGMTHDDLLLYVEQQDYKYGPQV